MPPPHTEQILPSILLIDDDAISREVMQMTLELHGFSVASAEDGPAALTLLAHAAEEPGLILMDTQMPGLSGVALVSALRGCVGSRIVAISASEPGAAMRQAADGFLLKPIDAGSLLDWLQTSPESAPGEYAALPAAVETVMDAVGLALVDPEVLGKLRAMMPDAGVRELYAAVAADLVHRLPLLESAMEAENAAEVARIAHAIKGGCAMVGLTGARDAAANLEVSNLPVTWSNELAHLRIALTNLECMLGGDFSA